MTLAATNPRELLRFLLAGGLNTGFGYLAFAFLFWSTANKEIAVVFSAFAGILFNFSTYKAAFFARGVSRLPRFILLYALLLGSNILLLRSLAAVGIHPYLGQAIIVAISAPVSFLTIRFWVFGEALETIS